jgi:hypothetical protein
MGFSCLESHRETNFACSKNRLHQSLQCTFACSAEERNGAVGMMFANKNFLELVGSRTILKGHKTLQIK